MTFTLRLFVVVLVGSRQTVQIEHHLALGVVDILVHGAKLLEGRLSLLARNLPIELGIIAVVESRPGVVKT